MPLGAACRLARDRRSRLVLIGIAAAAPVLIEAVQYAVMSLHRVCEGTDVLTNWLGLAAGYALAVVAAVLPAPERLRQMAGDR
jgi:glycopeptide antibiotics resistance protein